MSVVRSNKFGPECTRWLNAMGWHLTSWTGGTHAHFEHPRFEPINLASSPSVDPRKQLLGEIARKSGKAKPEIEIALGLRQKNRTGPKVRRKRNEAGRSARTFTVVKDEKPGPERVGTAAERMESIADEIGAATQGLNYATGDEYDSLLSELSRLRGEYVQLEHDRKVAA